MLSADLFLEKLAEVFMTDVENINLSEDFRDFENWDSLTFLELLAMLNMEFNVIISHSEFNKLNSGQDIYDYILNQK